MANNASRKTKEGPLLPPKNSRINLNVFKCAPSHLPITYAAQLICLDFVYDMLVVNDVQISLKRREKSLNVKHRFDFLADLSLDQ